MCNHNPAENTSSTEISITRRSCLTGIAAGTGLIAGCFGSGNDTGFSAKDVPEFSVDESAQPTPILLAYTIPESSSIEFLDEFELKLAIGNAGGSPISDQTIELGMKFGNNSDDPFSPTVNVPEPVSTDLPEIESGEWKSIRVSMRVNAGGNWTIKSNAVAHPSFNPQIDVKPKQLNVGDVVSSEIGHFEIRALKPEYRRAIHYQTEEGGIGMFSEEATGLIQAEDGNIFVVHRFHIENTSGEKTVGFGRTQANNGFGNANIIVRSGQTITSDRIRDPLDVGENKELFGDNYIDTDQTKELVVIQEIEETKITEATMTLSLWGNSEDILFDTIQESPAVPEFELESATVSEQDDGTAVINLTVKNIGEGAGTFYGAGQFYASRPTASNWVFLPDGITMALDPGEKVTESFVPSRGGERFRILPFKKELEV
ncbi:hypothetical protein [Halobacteriaceae bacterium SHR40]|uniref:hypothetical protein n=1 Tax=Halovenus amylolytica TaxID=2500550 RepID=UPI000FE43DFE